MAPRRLALTLRLYYDEWPRREKRRQRCSLWLIYFRRRVLEKANNKKAAAVCSFPFVESGLTGPLLVELFYGVQIHNPVVCGAAPAL
jgi:hypothetical protein